MTLAAGKFNRLYTSKRWRKLRRTQLDQFPLCQMCAKHGRVEPATVVDHVDPHRGDMDKFWYGKLQSLCKHCHDSHKKRLENGGGEIGCDTEGFPIDQNHHWS